MTTVATDAVKGLASDWVNRCGYSSAILSGIIGNEEHQRRGGYHIGRRFQSPSNYSAVRPDDKDGPDDAAAAIDVTMSPADMRLCTSRLVVAYSNPSDPRRKYLNAFNGTTNNLSARRWDVYARKISAATSDHLWHMHVEIRRRYVNSATAMRAIRSILSGESLSSYLKSAGATMVPVSNASTSAPPFPGTLRRNDAATKPNPHVKKYQAQLRKIGYPGVLADGFFGAKTEAAVKALQKKRKLTVDGVIGPKTWPAAWK